MASAMAQPITVIPNRLMWAPESWLAVPGVVSLPAGDLIGSTKKLYAVPHYSTKAVGRAFGPVALDRTVEFCFELCKVLRAAAATAGEDGSPVCYALTTPPEDVQTRTNVATMLGAYLVLRHGYSARRVKEVLGAEDSDRRFACSWSRSNKPEGKRHHRVYDCWAGLELAVQLEWIDQQVVFSQAVKDEFCQRHRKMSLSYDSAWIVPGRLFVCADPQTTIHDANPNTFNKIFPTNNPKNFTTGVSTGSNTSLATSEDEGTCGSLQMSAMGSRRPSVTSARTTTSSLFCDNNSTDTVCKEEGREEVFDIPAFASNEEVTEDFVTFLKTQGVRVIIRCNFDDEPGMPKEGGYDCNGMIQNGIDHVDMCVPDYDGGLPTKSGFRNAVDLVHDVLACAQFPNAVAVHCKGGFGRSVVLACCLAIDYYDIDGGALMGWVRMARPGSLTSPIQERLLKKMTSRKAMRRWAGMRIQDDEQLGKAASAKCGPQCSVM